MQLGHRHSSIASVGHVSRSLTAYTPRSDIGATVTPLVNGKVPTEFIPTKPGTSAFTEADRTKLDGIEQGAQRNVGTNLSIAGTNDVIQINSSTGSYVELPIASNLRGGVMSRAMFQKLAGIEEGAQKWRAPTLAEIGLDRVNNTSDMQKPVSAAQQLALDQKEPAITAGTAAQYFSGTKTWRSLASDVLGVVISTLSAGSNAAIAATDTIVIALAKLQAQISVKENKLAAGTASQYLRGDKTWSSFATDVKSVATDAIISGLSLTVTGNILSTDSIVVALAKLQVQITSVSNSINGLMLALADRASLSADNSFAGAMYVQGSLRVTNSAFTPTANVLFNASGIAINPNASNVFEVAPLTGNTSLILPTAEAGRSIQIRFQQDSVGNRTITLPTEAKVSGSLSTAANSASWLCITKANNGNWEGNWFNVPA